ncbi:unnamed protein product [Diamesa serratosioi]
MEHVNQVFQLFVGYSMFDETRDEMKANCSVTLVKSESKNILIDCLTAWDRDILLLELNLHNLKPEQIDYVVCTHGHSDHIGNLNLFLNAKHFVGSCLSHKHIYFTHNFDKEPYHIDKNVEVIATPGHTGTCISVIVKNTNLPNRATVAIAGDLFEKEEDIFKESLWIDAGSEHKQLQRKNRLMIAEQVEHIIPGHGPIFKVDQDMRDKLMQDNLKKD